MKISYDDLLKDYEEMRNQMIFLLDELAKNGVTVSLNPTIVEVDDITASPLEKKKVFAKSEISNLDFTEHDKVLENKIKNKLEKKLSILEKENQMLMEENKQIKNAIHTSSGISFDSPLDFAKSLIEHRTHFEEIREETYCVPEHERVTFDYDELEEIAEYLLVYCKHNKEL